MPATATVDPLIDRFRSLLGRDAVLANPSDLVVYECDAFTVEKNRSIRPPPLGLPGMDFQCHRGS